MTAAHEWSLWSTTARLVVTDPAALEPALELVHAELAEVELAASRFRPDSEVVDLVAGRNLVSPLLAELLHAALDAARRTDGAVDPTVGTAVSDLGYDRDISLVERDGRMVAVVRPAPGWRTLHLEGQVLTLPAGLRIDLGATAKALAADRCARLVHDRLHTGVLVSLGGDIATAGPAPEGDWQVLVQDTDDDPATRVGLPGGTAVATSSTVRRTWRRAGRPMHHIVDPASGAPADPVWRSVTVAAPTCLEANTLATAAVVKGHAGLDWLRGQGLPARLVDADRRVVLLAAWPEEVAA